MILISAKIIDYKENVVDITKENPFYSIVMKILKMKYAYALSQEPSLRLT